MRTNTCPDKHSHIGHEAVVVEDGSRMAL
jgi:hypothetical protein